MIKNVTVVSVVRCMMGILLFTSSAGHSSRTRFPAEILIFLGDICDSKKKKKILFAYRLNPKENQ
jgi:hypothetical protein